MKCGRCNKELGHADESNACYITNAADAKTFGAVEVEEYVVVDNGIEISRGQDFIAANSIRESRVNEIDYTKAQKEISKNHATDPQEIETLTSEIDILILSKNKVKVSKEVKVKLIPKTLVICKDCKADDDKVIWG